METIDTTPEITPDVDVDVVADMPTPDPQPDARPAKPDADSPLKLLRKQLDALKAENEGYKRRDEDARRAKMTEEQRIKAEVEELRAERDRIANENMRRKIASEYRLPDAMINRLVGSDEDSLRADAEELANLLPKTRVGSVSNPMSDNALPNATQRIYKSSEIEKMSLAEFQKREAEITKAMREGRVIK